MAYRYVFGKRNIMWRRNAKSWKGYVVNANLQSYKIYCKISMQLYFSVEQDEAITKFHAKSSGLS